MVFAAGINEMLMVGHVNITTSLGGGIRDRPQNANILSTGRVLFASLPRPHCMGKESATDDILHQQAMCLHFLSAS